MELSKSEEKEKDENGERMCSHQKERAKLKMNPAISQRADSSSHLTESGLKRAMPCNRLPAHRERKCGRRLFGCGLLDSVSSLSSFYLLFHHFLLSFP